MSRDIQLKERWENVVSILSNQFSQGEDLDLDAIIYLIGVQEYGRFQQLFKKDEKVNLMHIAICRLLEPYGYYEFDYVDKEGWPHYKIKEEINIVVDPGMISLNFAHQTQRKREIK